jgi:hypothetical protein
LKHGNLLLGEHGALKNIRTVQEGIL